MEKPSVVLADDHRLVVAGMKQLLASECTIVAAVYDGDSVVHEVHRCDPDIAVIDLCMPPAGGLDVIRRIRQFNTTIGIIVVTMNDDLDIAMQAFREGASAFLLKNCSASDLKEAVRHVMKGDVYVSPLVAGGIVKEFLRPAATGDRAIPLTARQRDVLRLLADGKSMKQVADALSLTPRTVAFHKYRMMRQLNIASSAELVRYAVNRKIV